VRRWDIAAPTDGERDGPRVLFSTAEARGIVIGLAGGEEMRDHQVRERAILQVLEGRIECASNGASSECGVGTLIVFEPGEPHSVRAVEPARLLLLLAPWPAPGHYDPSEHEDPHELPVNAVAPPRESG
jgi:quercetin dioxygenase-like cupin family protein